MSYDNIVSKYWKPIYSKYWKPIYSLDNRMSKKIKIITHVVTGNSELIITMTSREGKEKEYAVSIDKSDIISMANSILGYFEIGSKKGDS